MSPAERRTGPEFRVEGRTLAGIALPYGEVSPQFRERFAPGAFGDVGSVDVNLQHDPGIVVARGATLTDSPEALRVRATLGEGSGALALVRRGALNGFSVEFHARAEHRDESGVRVIERAELAGLSLVDRGAYPGATAEVRARGDRGGRLGTVRGRVPAGKQVDCRCAPGNCKRALFKKGSLDDASEDEAREVLAVAGEYANAIASKKRGGVRFWKGKDGDLEFAIDIPNTDRGRMLREAMDADAVPIYARPVIDIDASDVSIVDELATYRRARIRALTLGPTDADRGWPALVLGRDGEGAPESERSAPPASRRARVWL